MYDKLIEKYGAAGQQISLVNEEAPIYSSHWDIHTLQMIHTRLVIVCLSSHSVML